MECPHLINIANPAKDFKVRRLRPILQVPCGRCIACTQKKAREWTFRLWHENKVSSNSQFITLTYRTEFLPINDNCTYPEFDKPQLQNYLKRLKDQNQYKDPARKKLKYYAVAEYGGETGRPHYHIILFNNHLTDRKIEELWYKTKKSYQLGRVDIQPCNMATMSYVAGYIMKRDTTKSEDLKRTREFSICSKGLGINYVEKTTQYHQENLTFMSSFQGDQIQIPNYFKQKIFEPEQIIQISEDNRLNKEHEDSLLIPTVKNPYPKARKKEHAINKIKGIISKQKRDKF